MPAADQAASFVPAMPRPLPESPSIFTAIWRARRDLLSVWCERDYERDLIHAKVLGRQILIANSPETVRQVMVTDDPIFHRKGPQMRRALEHLIGDGLFISDGDLWAQRRAAVAPIVHSQRLHHFVPPMAEVADEWLSRWRDIAPGTTFDMLSEMANLTAAIITRAVFGRNLDPALGSRIVEGFSRYQSSVDQMNIGYYLGADEGWPNPRTPRLRRATRLVRDSIAAIVEDHEAGRGDGASITSMLLQGSSECPAHGGLTREAVANEVATIFMAGHETTANTLAWAWYLLSQQPQVAQRVRAEADAVLGAGTPTVETVGKLTFSRAVIDETLRLYPPVPILIRQASAAAQIGPHRINSSDLVLVVPWLLHRHRKYWDRPNHFVPERFLDSQPAKFSYIPFAVGPRICAGLSFGRTEAVLCLAMLARHFDIALADGAEVTPHCRLTLRPKGGLPMTLAPRRDAAPRGAAAAS